MNEIIVFGPFWLFILAMGARWAYVKIRSAVSPQYRVKRQQAEADAYAKRKASREAAQARRTAAELEWALNHPDTTEGNRLLGEKLDEQTKILEGVEREIRTWSRLAEGTHSGAEDAKVTLAEAEAARPRPRSSPARSVPPWASPPDLTASSKTACPDRVMSVFRLASPAGHTHRNYFYELGLCRAGRMV